MQPDCPFPLGTYLSKLYLQIQSLESTRFVGGTVMAERSRASSLQTGIKLHSMKIDSLTSQLWGTAIHSCL